MKLQHLLIGASVFGIANLSTVAIAQSASPQSVQAQDSDSGIGEIIVTANKREESQNKVGLTITAISADALADRKITSLADIASVVPGLVYTPSANATPIFTLRGIGFNESSLGVYPAVSVYIDQAPLPFPVLASHTAYDLERVEVLKGPQGTLFGQNATGGAINYIAAKPTSTFEAGGDIGFGRFNQIEGNAYLSGPISDNLRGRLAVTGLNADGWQISTTRPNDRNGKQSYVAGRLILDLDASDALRFSLNLNAWVDKSEPQAPQLIALRPQIAGGALPQELTTPLTPGGSRAADWSIGDRTPRGDRQFQQAVLRADLDLTSNVTLTSLTSYAHFKQETAIDSDGSDLVLNDLETNDGNIKTFNQELRIANTDNGPLRWVIGANYENSKTFENQVLRYFDDSVNYAGLFFINASGVRISQDIRNYAFFANGEYALTSRLSVKAGIRYTNSRNKTNICGYSPGDGHVADLYNFLPTLPTFNPRGNPFTPIGPNDCYTLNYDDIPGFPFIGTLKENNVSWRVGADYRINDRTLIYANVSRGYKAGSFPSLAAATFATLQPVTQESVTSYEAGIKAGLFDRKVQLNAAAFYYDYKNKQVRGKTFDPVFGILDILTNVPKSRVMGAEADLTVRPTRGLTLGGSVTYLDSKIQTFNGYDVLGFAQNFSGNPLPFTPKWNYSVTADYRYELPNGGEPFIGVSLMGNSKSDASPGSGSIQVPVFPGNRTIPGLVNPFTVPSRTTIDLRLGYEAPDKAWKVLFWGKNVANKYYWTNAVVANDAIFRVVGRPATYGVTVGFKMK